MRWYKNVFKDKKSDKIVRDPYSNYIWGSYILMILIGICSLIMYFTADNLNMRPVNQIICYDNVQKKDIRLLDMIVTEYKKRDIQYDYSQYLRDEKIDISGVVKIKEIKKDGNNWNIITQPIFDGAIGKK